MSIGNEILRKHKNYKPTKFKSNDIYYDKNSSDKKTNAALYCIR